MPTSCPSPVSPAWRSARRGVRVILVMQGIPTTALPRCQSRAVSLLPGKRIQVYEHHASDSPCQGGLIDGLARSAPANIDPFSLLLAREANVVGHDPRFASDLRRASCWPDLVPTDPHQAWRHIPGRGGLPLLLTEWCGT